MLWRTMKGIRADRAVTRDGATAATAYLTPRSRDAGDGGRRAADSAIAGSASAPGWRRCGAACCSRSPEWPPRLPTRLALPDLASPWRLLRAWTRLHREVPRAGRTSGR
jgi:hypothetical protein